MPVIMQECADGIRFDHTDKESILVEHRYRKAFEKFLKRFTPTEALCGACSDASGEVYSSRSTGILICLKCGRTC